MKNTFYSFFVRIAIIVFSINSLGCNQATAMTTPSSPLPIAQLAPAILKNFYTIISNTKNVNYYKTKEIVFPVPTTGKEAVLSWGFRGSGNLFMPFSPITAKMRESYAENVEQEDSTIVKRTVYALIQDEINQITKDQSFIKILAKPEYNPIILFGIKVILLLKTTIETPQLGSDAYAKATTELMRLLFRLKLSCQYHGSDISLIFPESFRQTTEMHLPGLMGFFNELWMQMSSASGSNYKANDCSIDCFVFRDKDFAEKITQKLSKYKKTNYTTDAIELINNDEHQVVDFNKFLEMEGNNSSFGQKIVGTLCTKNLNHKDIPTAVKQAIENTKQYPANFLIPIENGTQWLVRTSKQTNSIKSLLLSIARTLHDYVERKKELLNGSNMLAIEYRKQYQDRETKAETIQDFLEETDGKASLERLSQEIYAITQPAKAKLAIAQKLKQQKNELLAKIQDLKNEQDLLNAEIKNCKTLMSAQESDLEQQAILQKTIQTNIAQHNAINMGIVKLEGSITPLDAELNQIEQLPEVQYEQNIKNLEELKKLAAEQQAQGKKPEQQLLTSIKDLQGKIGTQKISINFEQRIERRSKIADAFKQEAAKLETQLKQEEKNTQSAVKLFLLNNLKKQYTTYINHLRQEAQRIIDDNAKANQLQICKKAFTTEEIEQTPENQQELITLANQVEYLLTGQQEEDFMAILTCKQSDIKELIADLNTNEAFKQIKNKLTEELTNITQNSEFVKNHSALFKEIMSMITKRVPLLASITHKIS